MSINVYYNYSVKWQVVFVDCGLSERSLLMFWWHHITARRLQGQTLSVTYL